MARPRNSERLDVEEGLTEIGDIENPYRAGTNAFFNSINWTDEDVTSAVDKHGKRAVQHASRIGYDMIQKAHNGKRTDTIAAIDILPGLVALYGSSVIRHLVLKDGLKPSEVTEKYGVTRVNGVTVIAPLADGDLEARMFTPSNPNGKPQKGAAANTVLVQYKQ